MIGFLFSFLITAAVAILLHGSTRRFVRNRLRYVDAVQKVIAPWAAGGAVFLAGSILAVLTPIGMGLALTAGLAVGMGVAAGARDIKQGTSPVVYGP